MKITNKIIYFNKIKKNNKYKSNSINPFQGLPSYFIKKGKKKVIQKYFKVFFFKILQDSLHNTQSKTIYDSFLLLHWQTLPVCELKVLNKNASIDNIELIKIMNPRYFKTFSNKNTNIKESFGFKNIPRSKENNHPILYISSDKNNFKINPLNTVTQNKLQKRWTFKTIYSSKKYNKLSDNLYNAFTNTLIDSSSKLSKECSIALKYFSTDLKWNLKNFKFFQDELILRNLFSKIKPNSNKEEQHKLLEEFFFKRLLNKYVEKTSTTYYSEEFLYNLLYKNFNQRLLLEKHQKYNVERLKVFNNHVKNNFIKQSKRYFTTSTINFVNKNKKNNFNKVFSFKNRHYLSTFTKINYNSNVKIKIILKSFDKKNLKKSINYLFIKLSNFSNIKINIVNLPTKRKLYTVLSSPHVYKKARDQFEKKTYKSILVITVPDIFVTKKFFNYFLLKLRNISPSVYIQYHLIKQ